MKSYGPKNRKNQGRPQMRLLDVVRSELVNSWPNGDDRKERCDVLNGKNAEVRIAAAGTESCCREI